MSENEHTKAMAAALPSLMPSDPSSGNYKLLDPIGESLSEIDTDLSEVERASSLLEADSIGALAQHGKLVQTPPQAGESVEHYRARLLVEFQLNTARGTASDIFNSLATVLRGELSEFRYQDWYRLYDARKSAFLLPYDKVQASPLDASELPGIVSKLAPAGRGATVEVQYNGTFVPVSMDEWESAVSWDGYEYGPCGLDENGEPDGNGGTVGGLII